MAKKYEIVYNYIRDYIDSNKFTKRNKIPSENFLCQKFHFSRETVRKALTKLEEEGWIQTRQGSGSFFNIPFALLNIEDSDKFKKKIGVIVQGQDVNANTSLIQGIKSVLTEDTVTLRVMLTDNKFANERKCLNSITTDYDGVIIDGVKASIMNPNMDCYTRLYQQDIRVIFYNNFYSGSDFPKIIHNEALCADRLFEILARNGHRNIAGIFVFDNYQGVEKYKGYIASVIKYGAVFEDKFVKWVISDDMADKKQLYKTLYKFLKTIPSCTAIVCANYMLLDILQHVIIGMGKKVPDDYSVVCFDYSGTDWQQIGITSSVHPGFQMGAELGKRMLQMIADPDYKKKDYSYVFEPVIYEGRSVKNLLNS